MNVEDLIGDSAKEVRPTGPSSQLVLVSSKRQQTNISLKTENKTQCNILETVKFSVKVVRGVISHKRNRSRELQGS